MDKNENENEPLINDYRADYDSIDLTKYEYPTWFNQRTKHFYELTIERLKKLFRMNVETAKYYEKLNYYIFGPSITITAICSMASFLGSSEIMDDKSKTGFSLAVGILSVVSTAMQTIAGTCQYKSRSEAFRLSADRYEQLLTKLTFELNIPKTEDFLEKLEEEIVEVQNKNTYFPPEKISIKYNIN